MCFVKRNNFTVHNFFKRPVDFGCILVHYVPDYKKTIRENGHFETIPFNCFRVEGTKINENHLCLPVKINIYNYQQAFF